MKYQYRSFSGWLLIALLMLGQAALLAHESQHEINNTDNYCVICHNPSLNAGGPATQSISLYLPFIRGTIDIPANPEPVSYIRYTPLSPRAPPHYS